jgi:hypothetical protein
VAAWAAKVAPVDLWVGLRMQTISYKYDDTQSVNPLVEEVLPTFSYADGSPFDKSKDYQLGDSTIKTSYLVTDAAAKKDRAFVS